jgi:CRP-like cAMP-binding protein
MLEPQTPHDRDRRSTPETQKAQFGNRLLDALPAAEAERLAPAMRRVFLQRDHVVVRPGEPITFLHFPIDAFAWSWTETTDTQRPTSVLTIGQRGVVEWNRVLASDQGSTCATIISPGAAWRMPVEFFEQHQAHINSPLRRLLLRFANAAIHNAACRLACNAEHNIDQRLVRWLLWVADESGRLEFAITHQQIAEIAAIRRPSVSLALSQFQREGLIRSQHGRLRILDRDALENVVCRCYWIIRENADSVFKRESGA